VFLWTGWGKLTHLPLVTQNFAGWGIPAPELMAPLASGIEFFGAILLLLGLMTRIAAGALGVVMIVAVAAVQWPEVDSLLTFLGLEEVMYLALFLWLAIAGAGRVSFDHWLERRGPG
jgi:putative oxidoreductase